MSDPITTSSQAAGGSRADGEGRWPCPFCAEPILPGAVRCPHCRSDVVAADGRRLVVSVEDVAAAPSLPGLLVANVVCPGLGAWRLGRRARGALAFVLVVGAATLLALQGVAAAQALGQQIGHGGPASVGQIERNLQATFDHLYQSPWYTATIWLYVLSFVDLLWLWFSATPRGGPEANIGARTRPGP